MEWYWRADDNDNKPIRLEVCKAHSLWVWESWENSRKSSKRIWRLLSIIARSNGSNIHTHTEAKRYIFHSVLYIIRAIYMNSHKDNELPRLHLNKSKVWIVGSGIHQVYLYSWTLKKKKHLKKGQLSMVTLSEPITFCSIKFITLLRPISWENKFRFDGLLFVFGLVKHLVPPSTSV